MAFAAFADAPVDVAVIEVGMGGTWDNTNVADGAVAVVTPIAVDHAQYLGETVAADRGGEGRHHQARRGRGARASSRPTAADALLRRAAEVGATVAREGIEFGVLSRELAVGGQRLAVAGPARRATTSCSCRCSARTRPATRPARWPRSRRSPARARGGGWPGSTPGGDAAGRGPGRDGVRDDVLARPDGGRPAQPRRCIVDAAHNPAGMAASAGRADRGVRLQPRLIAVLAVSEDKDVRRDPGRARAGRRPRWW